MAKSLRWRLQVWHASILAIVVIGLGTAFYLLLERATLSEIDSELLLDARAIEGVLRGPPPRGDGPRDAFPPPDVSLLPPRPRVRDRFNFDPWRPLPPPPDQRFDRDRDRDRDRELRPLPPRDPSGEPNVQPYLVIFAGDGVLLREEPIDTGVAFREMSRPLEYRNRALSREVWLRAPRGQIVVVGRDIQCQMDRLAGWRWQLGASGLAILGLGLLGGWVLADRAIRPVRAISQTASDVSAANLSARIDSSSMDEELKGLADILNTMLSRLEASFTQQTRFTADASHELRTPIAVLLSHCELALGRTRTPEEYQRTLVTCQHAGRRMKTLVEDLLILARADAGKLELSRQPCDLQRLAADAAAMLGPLAAQRGVTIECIGDAAPLDGDDQRLSQVIVNLLSNAIEYNRTGGAVTLRTSLEPGAAMLSVRDTGCGIAGESVPHLFDRFYRVDEARSRQIGGSGLGLAICQSIVEAHGGTLDVTSEVNVGSEFVMRIPTGLATEK